MIGKDIVDVDISMSRSPRSAHRAAVEAEAARVEVVAHLEQVLCVKG
jgi:hypothetical protein